MIATTSVASEKFSAKLALDSVPAAMREEEE